MCFLIFETSWWEQDFICHPIPCYFPCGKISSCGPNLSKGRWVMNPSRKDTIKEQQSSSVLRFFLSAPRLDTAVRPAGIKGKGSSSYSIEAYCQAKHCLLNSCELTLH